MDGTLRSEARVTTEMAQRYMTQLCKHFEHRLTVSYSVAEGTIEFPAGTCQLAVEPDLLILRAEAKDQDLLGQLENVVARHLERCALRDKPEISWNRFDT